MSKALFRTVLCPVDFSPNTRLTVETAQRIVEQNEATIVLLHVVQSGPVRGAEERLGQVAKEFLDDKILRRIEVAIGKPAVEILRVAERDSADLIVMATHGRTGVDHLILGSVAQHVVRESPVPVLTVRGGRGKHAHIPESVLL